MKLNEETIQEIVEFVWRQGHYAFRDVCEYLRDVNLVVEPGDSSQSRLTLQKFALRDFEEKDVKGESEV